MSTAPAPARRVRATCLGCVRDDLDRIERAHAAGTLEARGGWTAPQVLWHVGRFMRFSLDGFPFRAPLPIRMVGRLIRPLVLSDRPIPRGMRLDRPGLDALLPPAGVDMAAGLAEIRGPLDREAAGERFTAPSPLVGPLSHAQWVRLHAKHYAHHAAFLAMPEG
jgi:hypothetical protein